MLGIDSVFDAIDSYLISDAVLRTEVGISDEEIKSFRRCKLFCVEW